MGQNIVLLAVSAQERYQQISNAALLFMPKFVPVVRQTGSAATFPS